MAVIPQEYQEVEYLESPLASSDIPYIVTSINPNQNTVVTCEFLAYEKGHSVFGARWTGSNTYDTFGFFMSRTGDDVAYYGRFSNKKYAAVPSLQLNTLYKLAIEINNVVLDNTEQSITRDAFQSAYPVALFTLNNMGTISDGFKGRICSFVSTENNVVSANLIPCYRKSDNEAGMYDTVSGTFLTNAGTGEFAVGPDVTRESLSMLWLRRRMMGAFATPPEPTEPLGEYTVGYYNTSVTPSSVSDFVITHDMGVVPKVVIVEANFEPSQGVNAGLNGIYAFDVYGITSGNVAFTGQYWYNNAITYGGGTNNTSSATTTTVSLGRLSGSVRSNWNTSGTYTVRMLG